MDESEAYLSSVCGVCAACARAVALLGLTYRCLPLVITTSIFLLYPLEGSPSNLVALLGMQAMTSQVLVRRKHKQTPETPYYSFNQTGR